MKGLFLRSAARSDPGFIVVAVLWILGALATLVSVYALHVTNAASVIKLNEGRVVAEASFSAAVELAAYRCYELALAKRAANGSFDFRLPQVGVTVQFGSEAARIDLNYADKALLAGLFAALGADPSEAAQYAERIAGWRTSSGPDGPEALLYRSAGLTYGPRGGPFLDVGELWLVLGLPHDLLERAIPFLTVFSGQPQIDITRAAPTVIAALPGMTPQLLREVLSVRSGNPDDTRALLDLLGPARSSVATEPGKTIRVAIRAVFDGGQQLHSQVVILLNDDRKVPYSILSWQDELDDPSLSLTAGASNR